MAWSRQSWALLLVLAGNMLIDSLEVSTIVVAMPSIGRALHVSPPASSLFMISFAVGFGGAAVPARRVAAAAGRRRVYLASLVVFAAASLLSGLAPSAAVLVAARAAKGVCVALTAPTGLAIIADVFPDGPARHRAVSVYSLFGGSGFSAGLLLSGALTLVSWRWTLMFSGLATLALFPAALRAIPRDRDTAVPGAAPSGAAPGRLLIRAAAGAAVLNGSYWGFLFVTTFALQAAARWSPLETGLALLPASVPLALTALWSDRLVRSFGPGRLIAAGSLSALAGYAYYLVAGSGRAYLTGLLPVVLLVGLGFVLSFYALNLQAAASAPPHRRAAAISRYQMSVQLGGAAVVSLAALAAAMDLRAALAMVTAVAATGPLVAAGGVAADSRKR